MWQRDTTGECPDEDKDSATISGSSTNREITGLEEDSRYSITVRAINDAGSSEDSNTLTVMTLEAGERDIGIDISHILLKCPLPPAPSAAPSNVRVTGATSTTVTVQWEMVPCIHRNGEITGYSVRYSGDGSTDTSFVSGGGTRQTTISGLTPSTDYTIQVAAINDAGTGPYSNGMVQRTAGQWMMTVRVLYFLC